MYLHSQLIGGTWWDCAWMTSKLGSNESGAQSSIRKVTSVSTEAFNCADVSANGGLGVVAAIQLIKHDLA